MKSNKGAHGFPYKDRGDDKHPIKAGRSGQDVPPNCGDDGRIVGSAGQKKGGSKKDAIKHNPCVIGTLEKLAPSSAKSINKLPSGGDTRIV